MAFLNSDNYFNYEKFKNENSSKLFIFVKNKAN